MERSTFRATFARGNGRYELIVKIDWSESRMPLFKANCLTRKESSPRAKVRPCSSASPNPGCELYCSTCACRRTILCHSGARPSRLTRRGFGWLGHFDSASPEQLIPSCREPPRHFFLAVISKPSPEPTRPEPGLCFAGGGAWSAWRIWFVGTQRIAFGRAHRFRDGGGTHGRNPPPSTKQA